MALVVLTGVVQLWMIYVFGLLFGIVAGFAIPAETSIVPCNADLLRALKTGQPAKTSGDDNLKTMRLVYSSYESAARDEVVKFE